MIVCLCRAVSHDRIREAALAGATLEEVARSTGVASDCGTCAESVASIFSVSRPCRTDPCPGCPELAPAPGQSRAA